MTWDLDQPAKESHTWARVLSHSSISGLGNETLLSYKDKNFKITKPHFNPKEITLEMLFQAAKQNHLLDRRSIVNVSFGFETLQPRLSSYQTSLILPVILLSRSLSSNGITDVRYHIQSDHCLQKEWPLSGSSQESIQENQPPSPPTHTTPNTTQAEPEPRHCGQILTSKL